MDWSYWSAVKVRNLIRGTLSTRTKLSTKLRLNLSPLTSQALRKGGNSFSRDTSLRVWSNPKPTGPRPMVESVNQRKVGDSLV